MLRKLSAVIRQLDLALILALVFSLLHVSHAQNNWTRIPLELGGVGEDIQLLRKADGTNSGVVWANNMESGLYRSSTYSGGQWTQWVEYEPNIGENGLDAIQETVSGISHEYVLEATQGWGLRYVHNPSTSGWQSPSEWHYPNESSYPASWQEPAWVLDAAFYYNTSTTPHYQDPEQHFFASFGGKFGETSVKEGIYRWKDNTDKFVRVDSAGPLPNSHEHNFNHMWRDRGDQNVLYAVQAAIYNASSGAFLERGGLWKFSGAYDQTYGFTPVDNIISSSGLSGYLIQVTGFNQWKESSTIHSYVLAEWHDNSAGVNKYGVFHSTNLAGGSASFDNLCNLDTTKFASTTDDWSATDVGAGGYIIGRPDGSGNHHIWISLGFNYGVMYLNTSSPGTTACYVNGSGTTQLKRYNHRCFTVDYEHSDATYTYLFLGSHKQGLFYGDAETSPSPVVSWDQYNEVGYKGGDTRTTNCLKLIPNAVNDPKIRLGLWNRGLFDRLVTANTWTHRGESTDPQVDLSRDKACYAVVTFNDSTYFASGPSPLIHIGTTDYHFGGLYKVSNNANNTPEEDNFQPGSYTSIDDARKFNVSCLAVGKSPTDSCVYLTTGYGSGAQESGCPTTDHYLCRKYKNGSNWEWQDLYTATSANYPGVGFSDLHANPGNPTGSVFASTGQPFPTMDMTAWQARLERFNSGSDPWDKTIIYTSSHDRSSIMDFELVRNGTVNPDIYTSENWILSTDPRVEGDIRKFTYSGGYTGNSIYPASLQMDDRHYEYPPQPGPLAVYMRGSQQILVTPLWGKLVSSGKYVSDLFAYDGNLWKRLNRSPYTNDDGFSFWAFALQVDGLSGNDLYAVCSNSIFRIDNNNPTSVLPASSWEWVSFNSIDPMDSLKYLFAGCDSLEEIRDQYGHRFRPNDTPPIDSVYTWKWLKGFGIKAYVADTLEICGEPIPRDSLMILPPAPNDSSWINNYIAYLPADTMSTSCAFLADSDTVIIVKNDDGGFWRPSDDAAGFNMIPGKGYQVGVSDTLHYRYPAVSVPASLGPAGPEHKGSPQGQIASLDPEHFQFTKYTGDFYPIYISELLVNGNPPEVGDEVAVYTPENQCVGAGLYEGSFPVQIAAWQDDPTTEEVDGYTSGQTLNFKFWDASAGVEAPLEMAGITVQNLGPNSGHRYTQFGQGYYAQHTLSGSYVLPGVYALAQNYPNPFNPTTTIRYDLPFESKVTLEVFDIMGRLVTTLAEGKQSAGFKAVHWSGTNAQGAEIASGVYFYRLKATATNPGLGQKGHFEKTHKMVLLK